MYYTETFLMAEDISEDKFQLGNLNKLEKWRLILGKESNPEQDIQLDSVAIGIDNSLEALYGNNAKANLAASSPKVNRWLGDIRKYFKNDTVQIMQKDALERLNLQRMLLEPELLEAVEPDPNLVTTLLHLSKIIPDKTKASARLVVKKVVDELIKKLENPMRAAIRGALNRSVRNKNPKFNEINWQKTIRINLKHYQKEYNSIIPQDLIGFGKKGQAQKEIILCVDQSGSMGNSVVYSSVFAAILASLPAIKTQLIVFDTSVVDLSSELHDPVELLFGTQLGGGTDIHKALTYVEQKIHKPTDTIVILISDLYEGGSFSGMIRRAASIKNSGAKMIALLALDDEGAPIYDKSSAKSLASLDIPVFACNPGLFPELIASAIKNQDIHEFLSRNDIGLK